MALKKAKFKKSKRRALRVRNKIRKRSVLPRVSVFRSLNQIYVQIISDDKQKTLVSASSLDLKKKIGNKRAQARAVGLELARKAQEKKINSVCFDRGPYLYHGRVKALAEGLREGGLTI